MAVEVMRGSNITSDMTRGLLHSRHKGMIALQQQELMFRMEVMQVDKRKPATGFLAVFSQFQLSSLKRSFNSANGNGSNPWKH